MTEETPTPTPVPIRPRESEERSGGGGGSGDATGDGAGAPSPASPAPPAKKTKVPQHLLEKRRLGRIKAAEEFARKLKLVGIERQENEHVPQQGGFQPVQLINQKNYSSDYLKRDEQTFALRERRFIRANDTEAVEAPAGTTSNEEIDLADQQNVLVIQPGWDTLKLGFALDEQPMAIPNCVAHSIGPTSATARSIDTTTTTFNERREELYNSFKERMRYYKRRIQPNSHDQVRSFNASAHAQPQDVQQQNDPDRIQWIPRGHATPLYGQEALLAPEPHYSHSRPFGSGALLNVESGEYQSMHQCAGDAVNLLKYAIGKLMESKKSGAEETTLPSRFKAVLVVPDLFRKSHIELFIRVLLAELQFEAVALIQESLASCYGAGIGTSTCVVNIGAHETAIACVDEGTVVENSIARLDYGGDDITRLFAQLLKQSEFPYREWDPATTPGWRLAERLKKELVTFQDDGVAVQLTNFIKRIPDEPVQKYEFKIFDEVMLAPLALFYPAIFKLLKPGQLNDATLTNLTKQLPTSRDLFTNELNDWRSLTQEETLHDAQLEPGDSTTRREVYTDIRDETMLLHRLLGVNDKADTMPPLMEERTHLDLNMLPLDKAIIQSITNASLTTDPSKMSTYYSNILVIGGSSNIEAFDFMLTDRINIWRPRLLSMGNFSTFYEGLAKRIKEMEKKFNAEKPKAGAATATTTKNDDDDDDEDNDDDDDDKNAGDQTREGTVAKDEEQDSEVSRETTVAMMRQEFDESVKEVVRTELQQFMSILDKTNNHNEHYSTVTILPPPKEIDASYIGWKGASVLAQVKLVEELYITSSDWDMHGSRILQYKSIFTY